jgi:hypothetical protein
MFNKPHKLLRTGVTQPLLDFFFTCRHSGIPSVRYLTLLTWSAYLTSTSALAICCAFTTSDRNAPTAFAESSVVNSRVILVFTNTPVL